MRDLSLHQTQPNRDKKKVVIRNEQEKKCWKANLYLVLGMILLGCYVALEYYIVFIIR